MKPRIEELIRPSLHRFEAYSSARSLGINAETPLDANELSLGSAVDFNDEKLNRYPDPESAKLRQALGDWLKVETEKIFVSAGADQAIDLLIRLFCEPFQDEIAVTEPTYGMYKTCAEAQGVHVRRLKLNRRFDVSAKEILPRLKGVKILFLCSPNNPTGNVLDAEQIRLILQFFDGLVVIDQAYLEFCDNIAGHDWSKRIDEFERLVVLRTFSKAWGLAALRLGYAIGAPAVVAGLKQIMPPYPVSGVSAALGLKALAAPEFLVKSTEQIRQERERLAHALKVSQLVKAVFPSDANFLLARFKDSGLVFSRCLERGICLRRRNEPSLRDCLRITVGTSGENKYLLKSLEEITTGEFA
jgi:histidinol-phosphate aminotransferase